MSKAREWWNYWQENIKSAKERFDIIVLILSALLILVGLLGAPLGFSTNHHFSEFCERAAATILCIWCFAWLPFHRHEIVKKESEETHSAEKQKLEAEIKSLNEQLKEAKDLHQKEEILASDRRLTKAMLANELATLQNRLNEAIGINEFLFRDQKKDFEWKRTDEILSKIEDALYRLLSPAEAVIFRGAKPDSPSPYTPETKQAWQWHVNVLTARYDELKKIIERFG